MGGKNVGGFNAKGSLSGRFRSGDGAADPKGDAVWAGLEALEGKPARVTAAYEDLCLGLGEVQVKQLNELVSLLLASGG